MKDILSALSAIDKIEKEQLTESTVAEVSNFDSKKVSTGTVYSRKYDPETGETMGTQRTAEPAKKRGRGRPKAGADIEGDVMKPDWSAFGVKPVKLSKDPAARKIKGRDTVDESVMRRAMDVIESALVLEKEMTDAQMAKREEIVKAMKRDGGMEGFKKRYGDRAEAVMYATATKQAMAEGAQSYMPSGEEIAGKRPEDETAGDKIKKFVKKVANKIAPDDETLLRDLEKKTIGEDKVDEDEVEEGNQFTGAMAKAKAEGKDEFEVDGKTYKVKESKDKDEKKDDKEPPFEGGKKSPDEHKDEFGNVIKDKNMAKHLAKKGMKEFMEAVDLAECGEPMMPAGGDVTISGTPDALAAMLKMAGMAAPAVMAAPAMEEEAEEAVEEEYANEPDEEYHGLDAAIPSGDDLHKEKGAYPATAGGDNPMAIDEEMWAAYQALKSELQ